MISADFGQTKNGGGEQSGDENARAVEPISPRVLLATMMSNVREGVIVVGEDLQVIDSNPAAIEIFAHTPAPLEHKRLTELTRNAEIHRAFTAALTRGERTELKVESRGDVDRRTYDLRVAPLRSETETEPRSAIGIFYDITRLERLERVRQEFLTNVSHELRTPLTAILAFVETLEDGAISDPENNLRFVGVIRRNAERMHRLINDILELAAIESGTITLKPESIELRRFVADIVHDLSAKSDAKNIRLENNVPPDARVFADRARLEQMLVNLIDNAIKFNRESGSVTICCARVGDRDQISVSDTGEGIAPEHAVRIFERFYRVDRARAASGRERVSTGLGLAIVKHLAKLHNGEAAVASVPGKGSTFTIELPRKIAE